MTNEIRKAVATFHRNFARAIGNEYPEALGLIDLAPETITGAANIDDLDRKIEDFYTTVAARAAEDGFDYITADSLRLAYADSI